MSILHMEIANVTVSSEDGGTVEHQREAVVSAAAGPYGIELK